MTNAETPRYKCQVYTKKDPAIKLALTISDTFCTYISFFYLCTPNQ